MTSKFVQVAMLAAASSVAAVAMAQALGMQPGQWEIVSTTTSMDMPGAPPGVAAMMRGRPITIRHCVTAEEVAQGPQAAMKNNKACTVNYHVGAGGRYTSEMTCNQGGGTMNAISSGTMTPTAFQSSTKMVMTGRQPMTMTSTATGHKVGECKG